MSQIQLYRGQPYHGNHPTFAMNRVTIRELAMAISTRCIGVQKRKNQQIHHGESVAWQRRWKGRIRRTIAMGDTKEATEHQSTKVLTWTRGIISEKRGGGQWKGRENHLLPIIIVHTVTTEMVECQWRVLGDPRCTTTAISTQETEGRGNSIRMEAKETRGIDVSHIRCLDPGLSQNLNKPHKTCVCYAQHLLCGRCICRNGYRCFLLESFFYSADEADRVEEPVSYQSKVHGSHCVYTCNTSSLEPGTNKPHSPGSQPDSKHDRLCS
mmetsp:Transcript_797/g.1897  ORF Transcript_797/g.1897 Transcript_797/m.1897 type:complete len:268 (+) Transcript_797:817-1620(+)